MSQQINLFNPVFLKQKKLFSALAMAQALGLIGVGLIGLIAVSAYSVGKLEIEAKAVSKRLAATQNQLTAIVDRSRPTAIDPAIEEDVRKIQERIDRDKQILAFVRRDESGAVVGYADFLRAFARKTSPGVWLTGFSLDGGTKDLEIRGRALHASLVAPYMMSLADEAVFKGRSFGTMVMQVPELAAKSKSDTDVPSSKVDTAAKGKAAPLRYIEFVLNTAEPESTKKAGGHAPDALEGAAR